MGFLRKLILPSKAFSDCLLCDRWFTGTNISTMFKKGVCYLLLCCFINMLTTLPAKCCVHENYSRAQSLGKPHSVTIIEFFFQNVLDIHEADASDGDTDCFCSVYNEVHGTTHAPTTTQFLQVCKPVVFVPLVSIVNFTGYNSRQFTTPDHYNFLFRLTPF